MFQANQYYIYYKNKEYYNLESRYDNEYEDIYFLTNKKGKKVKIIYNKCECKEIENKLMIINNEIYITKEKIKEPFNEWYVKNFI